MLKISRESEINLINVLIDNDIISGKDLVKIKKVSTEGYKIFLLGAKEKVVSKVANIYSKKYSPETIAGYRNGYFTKHQEQDIAKEISESEANILFVAMPSPKKEIFFI